MCSPVLLGFLASAEAFGAFNWSDSDRAGPGATGLLFDLGDGVLLPLMGRHPQIQDLIDPRLDRPRTVRDPAFRPEPQFGLLGDDDEAFWLRLEADWGTSPRQQQLGTDSISQVSSPLSKFQDKLERIIAQFKRNINYYKPFLFAAARLRRLAIFAWLKL